jgi:hypothetical protein
VITDFFYMQLLLTESTELIKVFKRYDCRLHLFCTVMVYTLYDYIPRQTFLIIGPAAEMQEQSGSRQLLALKPMKRSW